MALAATYPKVKQDLQVQTQTVEGVTYYVVKDPDGGKFIRLREPEYYLLTALDGNRSPQKLAADFIRTYNRQIRPEEIERFAAQLEKLGFLAGIAPVQAKAAKSIFFIKLKAFDPERLLTALYPRVKWLFSGWALTFQVLLIFLGAVVFFANISHFPFRLSELVSATGIITIIVSFFLLVTFHEFAHAFTCKHYGGSVREMGFLLLYFQPCFYCNLSDAYLFKSRRERIMVNLAGLFFQMVIWAAFTVLWRLTNTGYLLNQIFYLTAAVCFATLLFNFNPAIKLDGYYLLADWLQIPNLRQKAFDYLKVRIKRRFFGCRAEELIEPTEREARIYRRYGIVAVLYSMLLVGFILYRGAELLIGAWGGVGFVLFLLGAYLILRRLIFRLGRAALAIWRERKHVWMRPKRIVIYAVIAVIVLVLGLVVKVDQTTGGPAQLLAAESYVVKRLGPGVLEATYFRGGKVENRNSRLIQLTSADPSVTRITPLATVGDTVSGYDTLLLISSTLNEGLLAEAISELKKSEAERRLLLSDPKLEAVATKKSEVKQAEAVYEGARREYNRIKKLHEKNLISDDELEKSAADFNVASSGWESKKGELRLLQSAPKAEEIERIDAEIEKLTARRDYLQTQAEASCIVSPFGGVLVGTNNASELFHLARLESLMVEIRLPESDLDILSSGAPAEVRVAAFPATPFSGQVLRLKLSPQLTAIAAIANSDGKLLPNMNGYGKVGCGKISLAALLWRKISRFFRLEVWSWT